MKKTIYLMTTLFLVVAVVSCSKEATNNDELDLLKKATIITVPTTSQPVSLDELITPYLIPGSNNGGNRTCAEVATAFNTTLDYCWDKLDYGDYDLDGDKEFSGLFPDGLNVTVEDGKYISFEMSGCIMIGDKYYKVGAVIVKGSNQANVYYYPYGALEDSGLTSPINSSGRPAGLSNITFCFYECAAEPIILAVKAWFWKGPEGSPSYTWTASDGNAVTEFTGAWCNDYIGYTTIPYQSTIDLLEGWSESLGIVDPVGTFTINEEGAFSVTLSNNTYTIDNVHVFVGTYDELVSTIGTNENGPGCPLYEASTLWKHFDAPNNSNIFSTIIVF